MNEIKILILFIVIYRTCSAVSDEEYADLPTLFHYDDYDQCMQMGGRALYCSVKYELQPLRSKGTPKVWKIIQELKEDKYNFRHDHLRHWICVPRTCPNINITAKSIKLYEEINRCYNKKFEKNDMTGKVTELKCDTNKPRYPIDWIDILVGLVLISYISFVLYASFKDTTIKEKPAKEEYTENISITNSSLLTAFSIPKNWERLKHVDDNAKIQEFRVFQGIRFYNALIVIFSHSGLTMTGGPIANPRIAETMHEMLASSILAAGPYCVGTNFFLSSFLLTYGFYNKAEGGKMSFRKTISFFIKRCIRLLPILLFRLLLTMTWFRHWGDGPVWYFHTESDFVTCRKQGWVNLLFLTTLIGKERMCLPVSWYLAQDTQLYLIALILLWLFINHPKLLWPSLTTLLTVCVVGVFLENYIPDYPAIVYPYREFIYNLDVFRGGSKHWRTKAISYFGNSISTIIGIAFGYLFYLDRDRSIFEKYKTWFPKIDLVAFLPAGLVATFPGVLLMMLKVEHHAFWSSTYLPVARITFHLSIALLMYIASRRKNGIAKNILEWPPTYILARLSYSAYLMHDAVIVLRVGTARSPIYLNSYNIITAFFGDLLATSIVALIVTLFIELPSTAIVGLWNNSKRSNAIKEEMKKAK